MPVHGEQAAEVLEFWFVQSRPRQWFAKDPAFDALLQQRFLGLTRRAIAGELGAWGTEAAGGLALVLLLDCRVQRSWPSCKRRAHASEPSGPWVAGRWPVFTQMVQPVSLQGRCTLPGGLRSQLPAG